MKIGLLDVDGHNFPNIALMKISTWHKQQGDQTEMFFPMNHYDKVYMSKVFDFTEDYQTCINADEIIKGGTGYGLNNVLPKEIENIYPDYDLYGVKESYGYLTRGCPRGCPFCIVAEKEGRVSNKVADLSQFWRGQKEIKLLDPNLLASRDKLDLLDQLIKSKARIDFTQGMDARLLEEESTNKIKQLNLECIHFAWDNIEDESKIIPNLIKFKEETQINYRNLKVYVLTNYNSTIKEDLYRIYKLRDIGCDPYVMIFNKENAPKNIRKMQRWVNNKIIFRSGNADTFEEYQKQ